jgi:OOP family OmpA-OmpF porin
MKRTASLVALVASLSFGASVALANVEIGGTAGIHVFNDDNELGVPDVDNAESLRNSAAFGLRLGYTFTDMLGVEVEGAAIPSEPRSMVFDVWSLALRGHVIAQFRAADPAVKVVPFVVVGGGIMRVLKSDQPEMITEDTDEMVYAGVGAKYRVDNGWGLRADVRALFPPTSAGTFATLDFEALLSVYKEFGRKTEEKKVEPVGPGDSDGDGLKDDVDKCPNEAEDADGYQDEDGCPDPDNDSDNVLDGADKCPTEPEDADGFQDDDGCPEADNDADGIPDAADKCPVEAEDKDSFQDEDGCPDTDNDGDGVLDATDKCPVEPETANGFQDADGCPDEIPPAVKKFTGVIKGINFKSGSAEILKTSNKTLDNAVKIMVDFPDIKLEIQGHTDDAKLKKGSPFPDNTALSQARADSVKAYFVGKGVAAERLEAKGFGETVPIDPRKSAAARAKNRRVEFRLISDLAPPAAPPAAPEPAPTPAPTPTP